MRSASPNQQRDATGHFSGVVTKKGQDETGGITTEQQPAPRFQPSFLEANYNVATWIRPGSLTQNSQFGFWLCHLLARLSHESINTGC